MSAVRELPATAPLEVGRRYALFFDSPDLLLDAAAARPDWARAAAEFVLLQSGAEVDFLGAGVVWDRGPGGNGAAVARYQVLVTPRAAPVVGEADESELVTAALPLVPIVLSAAVIAAAVAAVLVSANLVRLVELGADDGGGSPVDKIASGVRYAGLAVLAVGIALVIGVVKWQK